MVTWRRRAAIALVIIFVEICFLFKRFLLRAFYVQRATSGLDVEFGVPLLQNPTKAGDKELRRLIIQMPLERFRIKNYFEYNENDDTVQIAPHLWQELRYYEIMDVLESAEAQITYYYKTRAR